MRRTFPPNLGEVTTRVYQTRACCSLKPLTAEAALLSLSWWEASVQELAEKRSQKLKQLGIEVNPEECIKWADDPSLSHQQIGKMVRAMLGTEL